MSLSRISTVEEVVPGPSITAEGRGNLSAARLLEHVRTTAKRMQTFGIRRGDCVASAMPDGPDAATARLALAAFSDVSFTPLDPAASRHFTDCDFLFLAADTMQVGLV